MHFQTILFTSALALAAGVAGCSSTSSSASNGVTDPNDANAAAAPPSNGDAGSTADAGAPTSPAIAAFWTALHAGDYASSAQIVAQLKAEAAANPDDSVRAEYLGVAEVWRLAEAGRDPSSAQTTEMTEGPLAAQYLQTAYSLDQTNYFTTGFLGITTVDYGVQSGSASIEQQGFGLIAQAGAENTQFGDFTAAFSTHLLPSSDAKVVAGLTSLWGFFDSCIGGTLNRTNPDYTPYFALASAPNPKRFCWNSDEAPHALEGVFLYMGDLLVKENQVDVATTFYKNAQKVPSYGTWMHASAIENRLSSDLNARAQAFSSADPTQWPSVGDGVYSCTQCHGATGL